MKLKSLLSATFLLLGGMSMYAEDTDISAYTKAIYIESGSMVTIDSEGNAVIPIKVKNDVGITGYQFNVRAEGIDLSKATLKKSNVRKSENVSFSSALQADGSLRAVVYTSDDEEFSGNDGEVATLTIADAEEGNYTFVITAASETSHGVTYKIESDVMATVNIKESSYAEGYAVKFAPFTIDPNGTLVDIVLSIPDGAAIKKLEFDLEFPASFMANGLVCDESGNETITTTHITKSSRSNYANNTSIYKFTLYTADADGIFELTEGIYPIKIKNVVAGTDISVVPYSTDVYVGSPKAEVTDGSVVFAGDYSDSETFELLAAAMPEDDTVTEVDLTGVTAVPAATTIAVSNPNALIMTSEDLGLQNESNVIIGKECDEMVLTDGYDFKSNKSFNANTASYTRGVNSNIGTICLPYSVSSDSKITYYELTGVEGTTLNFSKMDVVPANTPALFVMGDSGNSLNLSSSDAKVAKSTDAMNKSYDEWKLVGTFEKTNLDVTHEMDDIFYISSADGKFYKATGNLTIKPFRAYFRATKNSGVKSYSVGIEDETGVRQIVSAESEQMSTLYDLSGRQVNKASRGVYIQNGKKFIVK